MRQGSATFAGTRPDCGPRTISRRDSFSATPLATCNYGSAFGRGISSELPGHRIPSPTFGHSRGEINPGVADPKLSDHVFPPIIKTTIRRLVDGPSPW